MEKLRRIALVALVVLLLGSFSSAFASESYQRWIYWVNDSTHVATANEMADVTSALFGGKIFPDSVYTLSSDVTYRIPNPSLYLEYVVRCVKWDEHSIVTNEDVVAAIKNGDVVIWGNDVHYKVKNYYFSIVHKEVKFIPGYSGMEKKVPVLLINGKPKIKMDCGNPLEPELDNFVPTPTPTPTTTFGLKPSTQSPLAQEFRNFNQQAVPPVNVFVTNTNTNTVDFGPLLDKLEKMNQPLTQQPAVDLNLPKVDEKKKLNPWIPVIIGGVITVGTGTALYFLLRDKGGPVGAPGHGDGGPVGAPGHGDGGLKLLFRFGH